MNATFPLRDGYFRPLQYTVQDEARWRDLVCGLVRRALLEEAPYLASQYAAVDSKHWKLFRAKDQLRAFRRRKGSSDAVGGSAQCVMAIGTIEGTLEDVIYGMHHGTTRDMRVTTRFLSDDALDSAVLHVFDNGVPGDTYRNFGVKWRLIETAAGALIKNRDGVVLEYMGFDYDARGQRYAFHITETFDHPVCPPFSSQCAIRVKAHVRMIYRQVSPGRVGVYSFGDYQLSGRIPGMFARMVTAEIAMSLGRSVECAEAKKLTVLALTKPSTVRPRSATVSLECAICHQAPGLLRSRSVQLCQICSVAACAKCRVHKWLLTDEQTLPIICCKQCVVDAKNLDVDPRLPLQLVNAALWRKYSVFERDAEIYDSDHSSVSRSVSVAESWKMRQRSAHNSEIMLEAPRSARTSWGRTNGSEFTSASSAMASDTSDDVVMPVQMPAVTPDTLRNQLRHLQLAAEHVQQLTQQNHELMLGSVRGGRIIQSP